MDPNIKKLQKEKRPFQYCLTCYKAGHVTSICYKLKKETKKKEASADKELMVSEYVNHRMCEVQFGYYDLIVTNYLCAARAAFVVKELRRSEYINQKMCEVQYENYNMRMNNYLLNMCD